jgi:hypothetical protein
MEFPHCKILASVATELEVRAYSSFDLTDTAANKWQEERSSDNGQENAYITRVPHLASTLEQSRVG